MKLIGDIGGTKVLLALVDEAGIIVRESRYASADFSCFEDLLATYLAANPAQVSGGCLAVAGPVREDGHSVKVTLLPWAINAAELEMRFGLGQISLVNDFAAVAAGVTAITPDRLLPIQLGVPVSDGLRLVLGAGTGMGVAALMGNRIIPSEAGHIGFSPADETQAQVWSALHRSYGRVSAQRIISGPGLTEIHLALTRERESPEMIGTRALAGEAAARRSIDFFFACYGAFAGDMAMTFMARGGVYLAGGVTQKLLPLLADSPFLKSFNAKAEHAALVAQIPVYILTDGAIGLSGAAVLAGLS